MAERALGLEVQLGVAVAEVERAEPGLAGLASASLTGSVSGTSVTFNSRVANGGLIGEVLIAGFAHQVLHRRVALGELHATGRVAESGDLRDNGARHAGGRVAVVRRVELSVRRPAVPAP